MPTVSKPYGCRIPQGAKRHTTAAQPNPGSQPWKAPQTGREASQRRGTESRTPDGLTLYPSPSQDAAAGREIRAGLDARRRLASEVEVIWLDPAAQGLPWLREGFWHRRPTGSAVKAYTTDSRGRVVRAFLARDCDLAAYADLMRRGCGTCPIEAVDPRTIRPAVPALPAHPGLLALQREGGR